ncbi:MAG: RagB/SusD family nutrient uptake outer membrane protein [Marinifilaceae bacterium]
MRKILQYSLAFLIGTATLTGCDLDTSSTLQMEEDNVFKTTASTDLVLNGTWRYMMETFNSYANPGWSSIFRANDAMSSDVVVHATKYGYGSHYKFQSMHTQSSGTVTIAWRLSYAAINNCNNVIARVDEAIGTAQEKERIKGQAYAIRGFSYLMLASQYATAINLNPNAECAPIYTTPTDASTVGNAKSTVTEVYNQAIADLKQAETLIPSGYKRSDAQRHKIDHSVVNGLLARAYLYSRQWEKAAEYAAKAHAGRALMSESDYKAGFSDATNSEWIWGHPQTAEQSNASYNFQFIDVDPASGSYYKSFNADPHFYALFNEGDYRKEMFLVADNGYLAYNKFKMRLAGVGDIVLMRLAEMYLIEAEAKAHMGGSNITEAITALNVVKNARGATIVSSTPTPEELIEAILIERRKELFNEGFALVDIVRTQKAVVRIPYEGGMTLTNGTPIPTSASHWITKVDNKPFEPNSKYYIFNIPSNESTNNPNIN